VEDKTQKLENIVQKQNWEFLYFTKWHIYRNIMEIYVINVSNLNDISRWKFKTGEKVNDFCALFYDNLSNTERIALVARWIVGDELKRMWKESDMD
jgi:hypothetical protein